MLRPRWLNAAVSLTLLRIALIPPVIELMRNGNFLWALAVFSLAGVSDALDGYVARRFHQVTALGALLDPIADKLLIMASVLMLAWLGWIPWWLTAMMIARDALIAGGALIYRLVAGRLQMAPTGLSKINTFSQLSLIVLVLAQQGGLIDGALPWPYLFAVVAMTTAVSGIHYVWMWGRKAAAVEW